MPQLEGNALLSTVALLSCLGFLLIGYDNGLMVRAVNRLIRNDRVSHLC
jgi:hypothetical protein